MSLWPAQNDLVKFQICPRIQRKVHNLVIKMKLGTVFIPAMFTHYIVN